MKYQKKWEFLIKKYPERAGIAWEMYMRDKNKTANPVTYFNFAGKRIYQDEKRYRNGMRKWAAKQTEIK